MQFVSELKCFTVYPIDVIKDLEGLDGNARDAPYLSRNTLKKKHLTGK